MCHYEGIYPTVNAVIYYSNTGQSKKIADYFADKTSFPSYDVSDLTEYSFDAVILVFPVHCQSLPTRIKELSARLRVKALIPVATYGRMCYGDVLYKLQKQYGFPIIAAAYIPTKHAYKDGSEFDEYPKLDPILEKINRCAQNTLTDTVIRLPKTYKNPLSNFFPAKRSRMGVKLKRNDKCTDCGVCADACDKDAIVNGKPNNNCIRCLKCVGVCPTGALGFDLKLPMRAYLKKDRCDKLIIYV